ncbi:MAG: hypothetical protein Q7S31_00790 [bacterium]|nr:hypothetical protein [bacterium]
MGKKRISLLGSEAEETDKTKRSVQREQKKIREGKGTKVPGMGGGQRVADTAAESLAEMEKVEAKIEEAKAEAAPAAKAKPVQPRSKTYQAAKSKVNPEQTYPLAEAIKLLREVSYSPHNDTVELHINLKEKGFSQDVELPYATGKTRRVAIVDEATLAKIEQGKIDFDVLVASPADMGKLVKFAKLLGPRGLMPNPKTGTVVENPVQAAKKMAASTAMRIKSEKDAPVIHTTVGKLTLSDAELGQNISAVTSAVAGRAVKVVLKSSMSPAIKLAL